MSDFEDLEDYRVRPSFPKGQVRSHHVKYRKIVSVIGKSDKKVASIMKIASRALLSHQSFPKLWDILYLSK
jgi:hypothetical protein